MKRTLIACTLMVLASCTSTPDAYYGVVKSSGDDVERHLTSRYSDIQENCGTASKPAFLCTGLVIRATTYSPEFHSWDNSQANHTSGGVSFSFLRADSTYSKLAYGRVNGYVLLPYDHADGKFHPEILCSFPIDAATSHRDDKGCGASQNVPGSGACQPQGIYTPQQWYTHYRSTAGNQRVHQCGFDVRNALNEQATIAFNASIAAMALLGAESFATQNEVRIAVWPDGSGSTLPLEAFFYIDGYSSGKINAQNDQRDLFTTSQIAIPVISLRLPSSTSQPATFRYFAADQVIALP